MRKNVAIIGDGAPRWSGGSTTTSTSSSSSRRTSSCIVELPNLHGTEWQAR